MLSTFILSSISSGIKVMYYSGIYSQSALINLQVWMCEQATHQSANYQPPTLIDKARIAIEEAPIKKERARMVKDKARIVIQETPIAKHNARITKQKAPIIKQKARMAIEEAPVMKQKARIDKEDARITKQNALTDKDMLHTTTDKAHIVEGKPHIDHYLYSIVVAGL